jgi:hypothetical protein
MEWQNGHHSQCDDTWSPLAPWHSKAIILSLECSDRRMPAVCFECPEREARASRIVSSVAEIGCCR